ncbi:efflux RND transporter periplasmic adaptor subunit [Stenotrophomonas sp. CD2]|nr:efflux RND transporter periplasmic adaptor subunit [Stenotrophomonas sp. CD2]
MTSSLSNAPRWLLVATLAAALSACGGESTSVDSLTEADPHGHAEEEGADAHADEHADVEEEGALESTTIAAQDAKENGIKVAAVGQGAIRTQLEVQGTVVPSESAQSQVTARFPGTVRSLTANVGDSVKAGQVLATVDSNLSLSRYSITAPRSGVVITRPAQVGSGAAEGEVLFEIADLSQVWVDVHVFGADASLLRPGEEIEVVDLYGGEPTVGRVQRILPGTAAASQSVVGRAVLDNQSGKWRPGAGVNVRITTASENAALIVPLSAVQSMDGGDAVFVREGETYASHPVKLGVRDATNVQVLEGLKAGDEVVVAQSYLIKADIEKSAAGHDH